MNYGPLDGCGWGSSKKEDLALFNEPKDEQLQWWKDPRYPKDRHGCQGDDECLVDTLAAVFTAAAAAAADMLVDDPHREEEEQVERPAHGIDVV